MIVVVHREGRSDVVALCDSCRREITDASRAIYAWHEVGEPVVTLHKGACDETYQRVRGELPFSGELERLPIYLGANLGLEWPARVLAEVAG